MRNNLVRFAFVAGLLPLIIGSIVILVYWLNDYAAMHLVAFFTGLACLILVLLGLVAVFCALNTKVRLRTDTKPLIALIILLADFPIAVGMMGTLGLIDSRIEVKIINNSEEPLRNPRLEFRGMKKQLPDLNPGENLKRVYYPSTGRESSVVLIGQLGTRSIWEESGYVCDGVGAKDEFIFENTTLTVRRSMH